MPDLINMAPLPITMMDHEEDDSSGIDSRSLGDPHPHVWCKNCSIGEPTVVSGNVGFSFGSTKYVVYSIRLETVQGTKIVLRKRFSEFVKLREELLQIQQNVPSLPAKTVGRQFDNSFIEHRRRGLEFFLTAVLLDPTLSNTAPIKRFVLR
ncbi:unnamed protein product [Kuraishia capsulata CBS 1993]|uniref:Endosomal/vacuolar adapter protein YPT35 n=1 Tax=Kuraishia capsulata CBS 1993 TaxID=1382522 RepID=W6ML83_9ASCO|nr:uncharacterized protein KUCA_T00001502001 [Kuraishia capsulata CBS 1993]CDK25532.1 unnamed protein product [Kuraishia capsulata CBS 1993]